VRKRISELTDGEAVYSLYWAAKPFEPAELGDAAELQDTLRDVLAPELGRERAEMLIARFTAGDTQAGEAARAALAELQELSKRRGDLKDQLDDVLSDPPKPDKLVIDAGLSLLILGAIALTLNVDAKVDRTEKVEGTKREITLHRRLKIAPNEWTAKVVAALAKAFGLS